MSSSIQDVYKALHARQPGGVTSPSSAASRQSTLGKPADIAEPHVDNDSTVQLAAVLTAIHKKTQMDLTQLLTEVFESGLQELVKSSQQTIQEFSDSCRKTFQSGLSNMEAKTTEDLQKLLGHPDLRQLDADALARKFGLRP